MSPSIPPNNTAKTTPTPAGADAENCVFCRIVEGTLPAFKVYEDEHTLAFLGHTLVIPKKHYPYMHTMPEDEMRAFGEKLPRVTRAVAEAMDVTDYNILQNNGPAAGQMVFHVHVHIIPRRKNDGHWGQQGDGERPIKRFLITDRIARDYQGKIKSKL